MIIRPLYLGTLKVNAFEMIMGVSEELIREQYNVDANNQMRIGMNGLIVETGDRVLLFDPGCATFLSKSLAETYDLVMEQPLTAIVAEAGYRPEEITDVVFATDLLPMKIFMEPGAFSYYDVAVPLLEAEREELFSSLRADPEIIWYHE